MSLAHDLRNSTRTRDVQIVENVTFTSMLLSEFTLAGLISSGFQKPSPIQLHGVPLGKCGFDLLLEAKSGTGKTVVFSIIALEKLNLNNGLQVMILTPTREIAAQICDVIKQIGSHHKGLNVEVVMGGLSVNEDIAKFKKKVHIVVGSPGRLKHLIVGNHINLSDVQLFVLDECDKLVEKPFLNDINYIFSALPNHKQVIMSSATYPEHCKEIICKFVKNAQHICPDSNNILLGITQKVTIVKYNSNIVKQTQNRFEQLILILSKMQFKQCLIFCNYQARVTELHRLLKKSKWPVSLLHGQQEQLDRLNALKTLQEYKCRILISTDLAARGIDGSNIDLVINFEPPFEWQTYLHRIGRAGRFGSYGIAVTIISEGKESQNFKNMLTLLTPTFNLTNLWTDEIFNTENRENNSMENCEKLESHLKTEKNERHGELWGLLTEKDLQLQACYLKNNNDPVDKSNKYGIESFTNLVNSFQEEKETIQEIPYSFMNELPLKVENDLELFNIPSTSTNGVIDKQIKGQIDKENEIIQHNGAQKEEIIEILKTKDKFFKEENNQNLINKAMLESGLPICFGKTKLKRSGAKQYKHKYRACDHDKDSSLTKNTTGNLSDKNEEIKAVVQDMMQNETKILNKNDIRNKKSSNHSLKTKSVCDLEETINTKVEYGYTVWYNTLKNYMRHIEFSVYIDELSRMY